MLGIAVKAFNDSIAVRVMQVDIYCTNLGFATPLHLNCHSTIVDWCVAFRSHRRVLLQRDLYPYH